MNIAIIDADLISRARHRFPNLACMKIAGYYKRQGHSVCLKTNYDNLDNYDKVFISKVFTDTPIDEAILQLPNVEYGGTGFFYDKAPALPDAIEHCMPDYHLYDDWVNEKLNEDITDDDDKEAIIKKRRKDFVYYLDYSIGFLTRGCFRQCEFCVNKNYTRVITHSPLSEFVDVTRKKVCLLDDNFFGSPDWKRMLLELQELGKPFQFKQGLDERILTEEKCKLLFSSKYDGDYIFAFDNIADKDIIEKKAKLIRRYCKNKGNNIKFYVLCAFDRQDKYDDNFWRQDIIDTFERIFILAKYNFKPYIMRFEKYRISPLYGTYVNFAKWCNQPSLFLNMSYKTICEKDDLRKCGGKGTSSTYRYYTELREFDTCFDKYLDVVPKNLILDYSKW